ncbi:MAG: hypothetical protein IT363_11350 [Methanoregulaceae archaeon]|nr:hypothetical protein [Methanoregulaceae archaeon]
MMLRHVGCTLFGLAFTFAAVQATAQNPWQSLGSADQGKLADHLKWVDTPQSFGYDFRDLRQQLQRAPMETFQGVQDAIVLSFPTPSGDTQRYRVMNSPILNEADARKYGISSYRVVGLDDPHARGRLDLGPNGFNGTFHTSQGTYLITPTKIGNKREVIVYFRYQNEMPRAFACMTQSAPLSGMGGDSSLLFQIMGPGDNYKTYRLAMNATGEYTAFYGSEVNAMNGVVTSVNRVNSVYEKDLAIRMNIVSNKCWTNASTDPFTNNNGVTMLGQNQTNLDATVGNANYDIGHVFSTGGGGVATLQCVGKNGLKARGVTGSPSPIGDLFDIDYVAHEMGHQYGANHTFAGTAGSCSGNGVASAAYEPGSGSTIMAYAGICGAQNVQNFSDAYFHYKSIEEIYPWRNNAGSGGTQTNTSNLTPTVNAGASYTIPVGTPFKLTATGSDPNNDPLTYCWEQYNLGSSTTTGALYRSRLPSSSPTRFFPPLANVISNSFSTWEPLTSVARSFVFRVTVRDNFPISGGYATGTMNLTTAGTAFTVTSPNTAVSWPGGSSQTVTWNVGGGSVAANVRILLSTNGGNSYGDGTATVLVASTANDGSETVTLPNINSTQARIIVEPIGNIFYDMSNVNFTITQTTAPTITSINPSSATAGGAGFTLTVNGTNFVNGTSVVRWNGSNRTTAFVNSGQLTATIPASDIATAGVFPITVANGATISNALNFTVNNPAPTITSITPNVRTAAGGAFTLTVNGSGFVPSSVVRWNSAARATTYVSATQLTASIPAGDTAFVGSYPVTVFNAAPAGGTSNSLNVTVNPIELAPNAITVIFGGNSSGGVAGLANSDDVKYQIGYDRFAGRNDPKVQLEIAGTSAATTASRIDWLVESSLIGVTTSQRIEIFNNSTMAWVSLGTSILSGTDVTRSGSITTGASNYVSGTGLVRLRLTCNRVTAGPASPTILYIDRVHWTIWP